MLEHKLESPDFVYFNLPARFASLIVTAPHRKIDIPENAVSVADTEELSIRMRNNGAYGAYPRTTNSDLLDRVRIALSSATYDLLSNVGSDKLNEAPRDSFVQLLELMADNSRLAYLKQEIKQTFEQEGTLTPQDYDARMEIQGAFYKGKFYSFEDFSTLRPIVEKDLEIFGTLTHVNKGDYLYRAVDELEWRQIQRDNAFLVRVETNFEDNVGPQVSDYAKNPNYAGKIIRIKSEGPFFRNAGMAVQRVTSVLPHFANHVEVLDGDNWINVRDYYVK